MPLWFRANVFELTIAVRKPCRAALAELGTLMVARAREEPSQRTKPAIIGVFSFVAYFP